MKRWLAALPVALWLALRLSMIDAQETPVKEPAREPFNKGLAAAHIQDWTLAMNYFERRWRKTSSLPRSGTTWRWCPPDVPVTNIVRWLCSKHTSVCKSHFSN
jgi:hypothetical protein